MDALLAEFPDGYLNLSHILQFSDPSERLTRLYRSFHFYQLRAYIHLPFLLRSAKVPRYDFSRAHCLEDCRRLLRAYIAIFNESPAAASDGGVVNFNAFTAATIVLLGILGYVKSQERDSGSVKIHIEEDWSLVNQTMTVIKSGAKRQISALLCRKCYKALESLIHTVCNAEDKEGPQTVVLPYFGVISISHTSVNPEPTLLETPVTSTATDQYVPATSARNNAPEGQGLAQNWPFNAFTISNSGFDVDFEYHGPWLPESAAMAPLSYYSTGLPQSSGPEDHSFDPQELDSESWNWLHTNLPPNFNT